MQAPDLEAPASPVAGTASANIALVEATSVEAAWSKAKGKHWGCFLSAGLG